MYNFLFRFLDNFQNLIFAHIPLICILLLIKSMSIIEGIVIVLYETVNRWKNNSFNTVSLNAQLQLKYNHCILHEISMAINTCLVKHDRGNS